MRQSVLEERSAAYRRPLRRANARLYLAKLVGEARPQGISFSSREKLPFVSQAC